MNRVIGMASAIILAITVSAGCSSTSGAETGEADDSPRLARAQALADSGDASALQFARLVKKPYGGCDRPNYYATVPVTVTGRRLAADELAFFAEHAPLDQHGCAAFLYVFHTGQTTTGNDGFTAGAVIDDDHLIEVHVGDVSSAPFASYDYH